MPAPCNLEKITNLQFRHVVKDSWYATKGMPSASKTTKKPSFPATSDPLADIQAQLAKRKSLHQLRIERDKHIKPPSEEEDRLDRYHPEAERHRSYHGKRTRRK